MKVVNSSLESVAEIRIWNQLYSRVNVRDYRGQKVKVEVVDRRGNDMTYCFTHIIPGLDILEFTLGRSEQQISLYISNGLQSTLSK